MVTPENWCLTTSAGSYANVPWVFATKYLNTNQVQIKNSYTGIIVKIPLTIIDDCDSDHTALNVDNMSTNIELGLDLRCYFN